MSSPSEPFECQWQASRLLLASYAGALVLALIAIVATPAAPWWLRTVLALACLAHALWVLPRQVLLSHPGAWRRLRHDQQGWQLWNARDGWQSVQLCRDSMALPLAIILRFRRPGGWFVCSVCVPSDSLPGDLHRRLRVRLRFSRQRWAAPE